MRYSHARLGDHWRVELAFPEFPAKLAYTFVDVVTDDGSVARECVHEERGHVPAVGEETDASTIDHDAWLLDNAPHCRRIAALLVTPTAANKAAAAQIRKRMLGRQLQREKGKRWTDAEKTAIGREWLVRRAEPRAGEEMARELGIRREVFIERRHMLEAEGYIPPGTALQA